MFEDKLSRTRKHTRPQYLRIKGLALAESKNRRARSAAGELFERVLREHPDDDLQVAMTHADLARWHRSEGREEEAARHFREAVACEDALSGGGLDWGADLDLAELIVSRRESEAFDEAARLLDRAAKSGLAFRSQRWRWHVTRARLAALTDDPTGAQEHARAALDLLGDERPDFPRHPDLGHISTDAATVQEVRDLANLASQ